VHLYNSLLRLARALLITVELDNGIRYHNYYIYIYIYIYIYLERKRERHYKSAYFHEMFGAVHTAWVSTRCVCVCEVNSSENVYSLQL